MQENNKFKLANEEPFSLDEEFAEAHAEEQKLLAEKARARRERDEILANLPDQRIAYASQKEMYVKSAIHRKEIVKLAELAFRQAEAKYKRDNPEASGLVLRTKSSATLIPEGKRIDIDSFIRKVLDIVMWRGDAFVTQKEILAEVNKEFAHAPQNSNLWIRPLPKWQLKKMSTFIDGNRPDWRVSLANCKSLADCRNTMLIAKEALNPNKKAKVTITVTPSRVLVNDVAYPISKVKSGKNEYPSIRVGQGANRKWIRVDALSLLLGIPD
jgi:hypothetical protein